MNQIVDKLSVPHYIWGDNCDGWILADKESLSVKLENMPTGTKEALHYHSSAQQFFFILKGVATFYIDGRQEEVGEQQGLLIAANTKHYIENKTENSIEFLVVSQPSTNNDRTALK